MKVRAPVASFTERFQLARQEGLALHEFHPLRCNRSSPEAGRSPFY